MPFEFRRVVTACDERGKSVVREDVTLPATVLALLPGVEFYPVWGSDSGADRADWPAPVCHPFVPPAGGSRWGIVVFPPEGQRGGSNVNLAEGIADAEMKMPGLLSVMEPGSPGMHTTPTVDYDIVLAGELHLELDEGVTVRLGAGSCVVQSGTRHAWHNFGDTPAVLAYVLLGTA